ncbi:IclR family transcriptional regulator domain-containing protein [Rhodococcus xishaensis]|uniref:Glycerol operon regulatory protein n=1 Tax=Rhodococcus xishaensis TaxID=2487364 RepID=A0A438ATV5_9NOCA|nr:IclR family transcriptional regulator C-terminal domain-containing protein [Rhodococcus xishaensis]RVW02201.1 IclR family transcriptional regulator [Rhodococcus xishaensis]
MPQPTNSSDGDEPRSIGVGARPKDVVQSLERGIIVLTAFDAEHPSLTLTEAASRCGLPRSATRRFLVTLVELGYVTATGRRFALTPQVLELGYANVSNFTLADVCQPHLNSLVRSLRSSASVTVLADSDVRYVCRASVAGAMSISIKVGSRIPAHLTAGGRVLLAALPEPDLAAHLSSASPPPTGGATPDPRGDRLLRELATVRNQGWALADQLLDVGVRALAVPIRTRSGRTIGALSASVVESQEPSRAFVARCLPRLLETAGAISLELRNGIELQHT